ncbi:hypothetical protein AB4K20DRAFT_1880376 [Rhizopus microsporus]
MLWHVTSFNVVTATLSLAVIMAAESSSADPIFMMVFFLWKAWPISVFFALLKKKLSQIAKRICNTNFYPKGGLYFQD